MATSEQVSKQQVRNWYEDVQRDDKVLPPFHDLELEGPLCLELGESRFENFPSVANIIVYDGEPIFSVKYLRTNMGRQIPLLSGHFHDQDGSEILTLNENRIQFSSNDMDVRSVGRVITARYGKGKIILEIEIQPPSKIVITRLVMRYKEIIIDFDKTFGVAVPTKIGGYAFYTVNGITSNGSHSAIVYTSDKRKWSDNSVRIVGGEGIAFPLSGVTFAQGGSCQIKSMKGQMQVPQPNGKVADYFFESDYVNNKHTPGWVRLS